MQTQAIDPAFVAMSGEAQQHQNGHYNTLNNSDTTRSQSRSTDASEGSNSHAESQNTNANDASSRTQPPIQNLNMALQQASSLDSNFANFNHSDLFSFQNNNPLLQYPMLSQFGRGGPMNAFETKPDVGQLQSQMQMREAKPYKCTQCVKSFANSSYLSQHMRIHLGIKPFGPCQFCGKKFTQLSHLQQHIRTHTGEKPYKCKFVGCEKAFSQLSNLQSHSRCHQTDKPFKCNSCYKCFSDEQSLLEHIPKHKESKHLKVHICPFCGKSYTQATYLQKHMTKHADRTRGTAALGFRPDFPAENAIDLWNTAMPAMQDNSHETQFAINQFANSAMMSQAVSQAASQNNPYNPALGSSAFTQLMNFRNNTRYFDAFQSTPNIAKPAERPAGFNMITPLENIQRYTQQGTATTSHQHFPSSIINHVKTPY